MTVGATTGVGTTPATNPVNEDFKIKDYTFLKSDLEEMQEIMNSGDLSQANEKRDEMAATIMGMYAQNGASISEEEALALVDLNYDSVKEELLAVQAEAEEFEIKDYGFLRTDLELMNAKFNDGNQYQALDMRSEMAQTIMDMYAENGSSISKDEALALVDLNYRSISGNVSVVQTIQNTTKSADSFWNNVPIVNLFIDDTSAEDLFDYMDDGKLDKERVSKDNTEKAAKTVAVGTAAGAAIGIGVAALSGTKVGSAIGAFVGSLVPGAGTAIGMAVGAGIGLLVGGISYFLSNRKD